MPKQIYQLPKLPFTHEDLWPLMSDEQLAIHHERHHQAYVNNANQLHEQIKQERLKRNTDLATLQRLNKSLVFNAGGHILHSLFWENLKPKTKKVQPTLQLNKYFKKQFASLEKFMEEFSQASLAIEGSGWGALCYCQCADQLAIIQIEKHQLNLIPDHHLLMVLDVWEHAYYLDYKNERKKYIDSFWEIVDWSKVEKRLGEAKK